MIKDWKTLSAKERIRLYNMGTKALRQMVSDLCNDPALSPQIVITKNIEANDYNPNKVAIPEMDLLEQSILQDGVTMTVVTCKDNNRNKWVIVDGFHRHKVLKERFSRKYIPCSEIDSGIADRMASTVRHNRARGKHTVELMASLLKSMIGLGWKDDKIAKHIGVSEEELLRLKQITGVAKLLAASEYSQSWGPIDTVD